MGRQNLLIVALALGLIGLDQGLRAEAGFIPGRSCGVRTPITYSELLPNDLTKAECVFIRNEEAFQTYLKTVPTPVTSDWSACSATCGGGVITKTISCWRGTSKVADSECEITNNTIQFPCNTQLCLEWDSWSPWSPCTLTCGPATRNRVKTCKDVKNNVMMNFTDCEAMLGTNNATATENCYEFPCTVTHVVSKILSQSVVIDQSMHPTHSPNKANPIPNFNVNQNKAMVIVYDNGLLLLGGELSGSNVNDVVHFEFGTGAMTVMPGLVNARQAHAVAPKGHQGLWVVGHMEISDSSTEVMDPVTKVWSLGSPLPEALQYPTLVPLNNDNSKHFIIGGFGAPGLGDGSKKTWIYDWSTNTYQPKADLKVGRGRATPFVFTKDNNDQVVVIAGGFDFNNGGIRDSVEIYQLTTGPDEWVLGTAMASMVYPGPRLPVMYGGKGFMMDKATNVVEFTDAGFAQQRPDLTHTNTDVVVEKSAYQSCDNGKCDELRCEEADTTYFGTLMESKVAVANINDCSYLCQHDQNCNHYVYQPVLKKCFYSKGDAKAAQTGTKTRQKTCKSKCFENSAFTTYKGTLMMSTTTVAIHDCQVACEQDANCNGYVYLPALKKCFKPTKNDAVQTAHGGGHQSGKRTCKTNCMEMGKTYDIGSPLKTLDYIARAELCQWHCIQELKCYYFMYHFKPIGAAQHKCVLLGTPATAASDQNHVVRGPKACTGT